ncbi:MAG: SAM-dependent methyltransferase [Firmicutes bacterium]|nr:SAM-dependent methyltransferase [Bacillota bacterium]
MNKPVLTERMQAIEDMVLPGLPVADIGTDHGIIPADILLKGICPFAVLTDINSGPLEKCRENLKAFGVDPSKFSILQGDGFDPVGDGGFGTVIAAGMGGELITGFFEETGWSVKRSAGEPLAKRFVLQPRTHADDLRSYLTEDEFRLCDYKLAKERGRICEVFAVEPCAAGQLRPDCGLVSEFLLQKNDPLIAEFIDGKIRKARRIAENASGSERPDAKYAAEIWNTVAGQLEEIRRNI